MTDKALVPKYAKPPQINDKKTTVKNGQKDYDSNWMSRAWDESGLDPGCGKGKGAVQRAQEAGETRGGQESEAGVPGVRQEARPGEGAGRRATPHCHIVF